MVLPAAVQQVLEGPGPLTVTGAGGTWMGQAWPGRRLPLQPEGAGVCGQEGGFIRRRMRTWWRTGS